MASAICSLVKNSLRFCTKQQFQLHKGVKCRFLSTNTQLQATLSSMELCPKEEILTLNLSSGTQLRFPLIWLRDNCQCPQCFEPRLQSRTIDWAKFDSIINTKAKHIQIGSAEVSIDWSDSHSSRFPLPWLTQRDFSWASQRQYLSTCYWPQMQQSWDRDRYESILKRFDFVSILQSDSNLLAWLEAMATFGVAIVEGTPPQADQVRRLAERVAFIRRTQYGDMFEVRAKADATNIAYLSTHLQLHSDLPYYEYMPGINMLHTLVQTEGAGGENFLTDGLHVARKIEKLHPELFRALTTTLVDWSDYGEDHGHRFITLYRAPAISLDSEGNFMTIRYSNQQRDSHFNAPLDEVVVWYKAHALLAKELHDPENTVTFKTKPGDIVTFNNRRLVHSRSGYTDSIGNERLVMGAFLDWDEIYSVIRVLKSQT